MLTNVANRRISCILFWTKRSRLKRVRTIRKLISCQVNFYLLSNFKGGLDVCLMQNSLHKTHGNFLKQLSSIDLMISSLKFSSLPRMMLTNSSSKIAQGM